MAVITADSLNNFNNILDFKPSTDILDLGDRGAEDVRMVDSLNGVVLSLEDTGQRVRLDGVDASDLAMSDFEITDTGLTTEIATFLADPSFDSSDAATDNSFDAFLDALGGQESLSWQRYQEGEITDAQITRWVGSEVFSAWEDGALSWDDMAYYVQNELGFTGRYQFGELILNDLKYYWNDPGDCYGAGGSRVTNEWDGYWSGKHGVTETGQDSSGTPVYPPGDDQFRGNPTAQEHMIREEFGLNFKQMETILGWSGKSLDDYIGVEASEVVGQAAMDDLHLTPRTTEITYSGLMAGAHIRGQVGMANLLLNGEVTADENGITNLDYMLKFGGYDSPTADELIDEYSTSIVGYEDVPSCVATAFPVEDSLL